MDILNNPYVDLVSFLLLVFGLVFLLQKDTETSNKTAIRRAGIILLILGCFLLIMRARLIFFGRITGGERCTGPNSSPKCTVKKINYSFFEKFLYLIGLDIFAQSMAKARFMKMGNDFIY